MEDSYIEYIRSTREKALQIAKNLSNEYEKMLDRIYDMFYYDILKEDMPKWLRGASPERLKVLKEKLKRSPLISELGKFIGLTGPNEVDINILYIIEDTLKNRIIIPYLYYGDPNYEMNLENLVKGLRLLSDVHPYLLDLALRVYHNRLSLPNFNQSMREVRELMYRTNQNVDEETLMFLAKKEAILRCVKNTVRGLFENLDKHRRLIEEGDYLDEILERYCK